MLKRAGILLLAMALVLTMALPAAAGAENFKKVNTYEEGMLYGVSPENWFYDNAKTAYELGLMKGSNGSFDAWSNITLAETITIAARMHSIYETGKGDFVQGSPWYRVYVDYALKEGILLFEYDDYNKAATRAEFAYILSRALPGEALPAINTVEDGGIPDVYTGAEYYDAVYMLYRAGVLTGNDAGGTFAPKSKIERAAVAAIITRMADPSLRRSITLKKPAELSASEIYAKCAPAVFYIETFDASRKRYSSGSGFFIDESGIAVTNYHVLENAQLAVVKLANGKLSIVEGVLYFDKELDYVVIKVANPITSLQYYEFTALAPADSATVAGGDSVYAIGNPQGLMNSISDGIISNPRRRDYNNMIQITAPISPGSSGGALIDRFGRVIGITTGSIVSGQSLNFAVPINDVLSEDAEPAEYLDYYGVHILQDFTAVGIYNDYIENPIPGPFEYCIEEPKEFIPGPNYLKNGTTMYGNFGLANDTYFFICHAPGTINIILDSTSPIEYLQDMELDLSSMDNLYMSILSEMKYTDSGSPYLSLSYSFTDPGIFFVTFRSKALLNREAGYNVDYRMYYSFTPDKPEWIK